MPGQEVWKVPPYKGFPPLKDFPLEGIFPYKGCPLIRDFPLEGISLYRGSPLRRDLPVPSPVAATGAGAVRAPHPLRAAEERHPGLMISVIVMINDHIIINVIIINVICYYYS